MTNFFLKTILHQPWWNLAFEECLSEHIDKNEVLLWLWQNDNSVIIGRNQNVFRECRIPLLKQEGIFVARRRTGGGAVYQDLGNLCFSFIASPERYDQEKQFRVIMKACQSLGVACRLSGRNDIVAANGGKFSGNAFTQTSKAGVHHGTIMVNVDISKMQSILSPSEEKMKTNGIQSVRSRVCNLKDVVPDITVENVTDAIRREYENEYGLINDYPNFRLDDIEINTLCQRYASTEWCYGESPKCEIQKSHRFSWGDIEIHMELQGAQIKKVTVFSDSLDEKLPLILTRILQGKKYNSWEWDKDFEILLLGERKQNLIEIMEWLKNA